MLPRLHGARMATPGTFELLAIENEARRGRLHTAHGPIETPAFMPVGTAGAVKGIAPDELLALGFDVVLTNTYHLLARPGIERIEALGGLHRFMNWPRVILTDSGGYQVYSLSSLRRIRPEGIEFRSPYDGARHWLTPELVMEVQRRLGSDIAMVLDECPPGDCDEATACRAVERTLDWAARCARQPRAEGALVFGIVQGGRHPEHRERCARALREIGFDGYAIGGVSVGEPEDQIRAAVAATTPHLPSERPRYVMGVGGVVQMLDMIAQGVDLFDCVMPTRLARHGTAFTRHGRFPLKAAVYADDRRPIDEDCGCVACRSFSRGYVRHLLQIGELLGLRLLTFHNLQFYAKLMHDVRSAITEGRFATFCAEMAATYREPSDEHLRAQPTQPEIPT